jgi:hypothetical protein
MEEERLHASSHEGGRLWAGHPPQCFRHPPPAVLIGQQFANQSDQVGAPKLRFFYDHCPAPLGHQSRVGPLMVVGCVGIWH